MLTRVFPTVALLAALAVASSANADVLIDTSHLSGRCIKLGVWYQSYSGGPRTITSTVYGGGAFIIRRRLTATTTWRSHTLTCPAPGSYRVRLSGAHWRSFPAHVPGPGPGPKTMPVDTVAQIPASSGVPVTNGTAPAVIEPPPSPPAQPSLSTTTTESVSSECARREEHPGDGLLAVYVYCGYTVDVSAADQNGNALSVGRAIRLTGTRHRRVRRKCSQSKRSKRAATTTAVRSVMAGAGKPVGHDRGRDARRP